MGIISKIANSKLGRVGVIASGTGAVFVPTSEMLNPPAVHAQVIVYYPEVDFLFQKNFFDKYDPQKTGRVPWNHYWRIEKDSLEKSLEGLRDRDKGFHIGILERRAREAFDTYDKNKDGIMTVEDYKE
ncbi:MAG: hypothetical protein AABX33_00965 [Nanoarchaeota archaeon]